MEDFRSKRASDYSTSAGGPFGKGPMYGAHPTNRHSSAPQNGHLHPPNTSQAMPRGRVDDMSVLAEKYGRLTVQNGGYQGHGKANFQNPNQSSDYGGNALVNGLPIPVPVQDVGRATLGRQAFMHNNQLMFSAPHFPHLFAQGHGSLPATPAMYAPVGAHFIMQGGYGATHHVVDTNTPISQSWSSSRVPSNEMPTLITPPRDSTSSNEDDAPGTPFTQYTNYGAYQPPNVLIDRSPHSAYSWATPSPAQPTFPMGKPQASSSISPRLQLLVQQTPAIPKAIPAPYSPMKPLDRSLENPNGVTNVYLRGLLPITTDEMLYNLASRFGEIVSSKSIIDHTTGLCKGYGFVKYHSFKDAEDCIRGFHMLGYETSFARESFYSQLKKLADEENTNLYVSNLPKDMNEHELGAIFMPHKVCSSKILRDAAGNGRGVGFARFESRDVCDDIIRKFNNTPVIKTAGEEPHLVQIRFADTHDQKSLKQQTTAARQYRTAEYESQTSGRSQYSASGRMSAMSILRGQRSEDDFENYMTNANINATPSFNYAQAGSTPYAAAVGRLETVSGHLSPIPSPTVIHVSLPSTLKGDIEENNVLPNNENAKPVEKLAAEICDIKPCQASLDLANTN